MVLTLTHASQRGSCISSWFCLCLDGTLTNHRHEYHALNKPAGKLFCNHKHSLCSVLMPHTQVWKSAYFWPLAVSHSLWTLGRIQSSTLLNKCFSQQLHPKAWSILILNELFNSGASAEVILISVDGGFRLGCVWKQTMDIKLKSRLSTLFWGLDILRSQIMYASEKIQM